MFYFLVLGSKEVVSSVDQEALNVLVNEIRRR